MPELAGNPPSMAAPVVSSESLAEVEFQPEIQELTETGQKKSSRTKFRLKYRKSLTNTL